MSEHGHWWNFGNYTGDDCPNCHRNRLVKCTDPTGAERVICEKCKWEPAVNNYSPDAGPD